MSFVKKPISGISPRNHGFTLVEMSIVLIIIALVIGGLFVGQTLIRQSQVNSVMTDEQMYVQAFINFQQKYNYLPGDFPSATSYWGAQSVCPPTSGMASPGGTATCNGDGNGRIANGPENVYAWQHLANAAMIQGFYTGIPGSNGSNDNQIGVNVPASRVSGAGFGIYFMGSSTLYSPGRVFPGLYGHTMFLGHTTSTSNIVPVYAIITPTEALSLDKKYDDGAPGTGNITAWLPTFECSACVTTSDPTTSLYNVSVAANKCALVFTTGF